jgi:PKD repeat protein
MKRVIRAHWLMIAVLAGVVSAACTMKNQEAPPVTGPSEFATSIAITISPDVITQDGGSQAVVTITARDVAGQPLRNVTLRLETFVDGTRVDVGSLSARTVVTGNDGRATATFTAPPSSASGSEQIVTIAATPIGSDFGNSVARTATVRLVPQGVVLPPSGLTPSFVFTPALPSENQPVLFDASESKGAVSYAWDFGNGRTGSGRVATNTYNDPGTYFVTLTIADEFGRSASATKTVTVGPAAGPTADFVFSPSAPLANQTVNFNASASRAPAGGSIVSYSWDFGDGTFGSGQTTTHAFQQNGDYVVTLVVTDTNGNSATRSNTVTVGNDAPRATFTFSPAGPTVGTNVNFNGSQSTAVQGRTIVSYTWSFGDGATASGQSVTHAFAAPGTYTVTLTVVDSAGKSGTFSNTVTVTVI